MSTLRVGLLGMADNQATPILLAELQRLGLQPQAIYLVQPTTAENRRRLIRKLKSTGILPTLSRVFFAIGSRLTERLNRKPTQNPTVDSQRPAVNEYKIDSCNSALCRQLLRNAHLDVLLIATDEMVGRGTFEIPRLGVLNAHPGWTPRYRGLGSTLRMLEDGYLPAISVHHVDEGVDTGRLILRQTRPELSDPSASDHDLLGLRAQAECFVQALSLLTDNNFSYPDTFFEPSSMTRGLTAKKSRAILQKLRQDRRLVALD